MRARALLPAAALAVAGCSSQWYPGYRHHDIAMTDVVIRTIPAGAELHFNGKKQVERSPIKIRVNYDHYETLYERQGNYGKQMREDMDTGTAVATAPVWGVASLFHYREDTRMHEYGGNVHVITARLDGYEDAEETITLEGEGEKTVTITLVRAK